MRFRLSLQTNQGSLLPFNYQYPLSSAIYKIIQRGCGDFTIFRHGTIHIGEHIKDVCLHLPGGYYRMEKPTAKQSVESELVQFTDEYPKPISIPIASAISINLMNIHNLGEIFIVLLKVKRVWIKYTELMMGKKWTQQILLLT